MKKTRRTVLGMLSLLPISSIAFANEFNCVLGSGSVDRNMDFEAELLRRLREGTLSDKYYDFLERHQVPSYDALETPEYSRHRNRLIKEFISDLFTNEGYSISSSGALSAIPPQ